MNILIAIFEIQDYGGIVGHAEDLTAGLRANGHTVDFVLLRNSEIDSQRKWDAPKNSNPSLLANGVNNLSGWYGCDVLGYAGKNGVKKWRQKAEQYDLVIYEIPVPKLDHPEWTSMFSVETRQLSVIHDAHYQTMYHHLQEVTHALSGVVAVHPAAYHNMTDVDCPVALIGNPIELADWEKVPSYQDKGKQIICAHIWKAWKNMDRVVAAAPHITRARLIMGGDGIEGRYMRSIEKCKPKYAGMWDAFKQSPHHYKGLISHDELMTLYDWSRVMVDMSYSKKFVKYGSHFNRSVMEALNHGCIPVCTEANMREKETDPQIFVPGEHYLTVPHTITPKDLARELEAASEFGRDMHDAMVNAGRKLLTKHFDRNVVAKQFVDFALGNNTGIFA